MMELKDGQMKLAPLPNKRQGLVVVGPPPAPLTSSHLSQNPLLQWGLISSPCPESTVFVPRLPSSSENLRVWITDHQDEGEKSWGDNKVDMEKRQRKEHWFAVGTSPAMLGDARNTDDSSMGLALEEMPIWWKRQLCKQGITDQFEDAPTQRETRRGGFLEEVIYWRS